MFRYIKNVIKEIKLVTWPTFDEWSDDLKSVIFISISLALFLSAFDWIIDTIINSIIR